MKNFIHVVHICSSASENSAVHYELKNSISLTAYDKQVKKKIFFWQKIIVKIADESNEKLQSALRYFKGFILSLSTYFYKTIICVQR